MQSPTRRGHFTICWDFGRTDGKAICNKQQQSSLSTLLMRCLLCLSPISPLHISLKVPANLHIRTIYAIRTTSAVGIYTDRQSLGIGKHHDRPHGPAIPTVDVNSELVRRGVWAGTLWNRVSDAYRGPSTHDSTVYIFDRQVSVASSRSSSASFADREQR
jgi:hypothetical protein